MSVPGSVIRVFALVGGLAVSGCWPGGGPIDAVVARWDGTRERYGPGIETIHTLSDPGALEGSAATVRARGDLRLDLPPELPPGSLSDALREALVSDPGDTVRPDLVLSGDVVVARDYQSFSLLSLYHHVESAQAFLVSLGAAPSEVNGLDVLYLPRAHIDGGRERIVVVDNFFYVFGARLLAALRMERLADVPLGQNEGIVTHEVSHALFEARSLREEGVLRRLLSDTDPLAVNLLDATGEGVSDFLAAVHTGDPDFIRHSVPRELLGASRDVSVPAPLDPDWIADARRPPNDWATTRYLVGTSLASALWRTSPDRAAMSIALVAALADLGDRLESDPPWESAPAGVGLAWLVDALLGHLDPESADRLCGLVSTDLAPISGDVERCAR